MFLEENISFRELLQLSCKLTLQTPCVGTLQAVWGWAGPKHRQWLCSSKVANVKPTVDVASTQSGLSTGEEEGMLAD